MMDAVFSSSDEDAKGRLLKIMQGFLISTILLGVLLVLLLYANVVLLVYHVPTTKR